MKIIIIRKFSYALAIISKKVDAGSLGPPSKFQVKGTLMEI